MVPWKSKCSFVRFPLALYEKFKKDLSRLMIKEIQSREFGSEMKVSLTNDGPVTIIIDTKDKQ